MDITAPAATPLRLRRFSFAQKIALAAILAAFDERRLPRFPANVRNCGGRPLATRDFDSRRQGM